MKKIKLFLLLVITVLAWACSEKELDSKSIFDTPPAAMNEFDKWISKNYTDHYNINFKYRYDNKESDNKYNLAPADFDKSVAMAKLVKHLWLDAYEELLDKHFVATYCPKMIYLVGSPAYNAQGSMVLGTAEGGLKVTLYNVNLIKPEDINIDILNEWYFKTIHHEFAHILHQTKNYSTDFNLISTDYQGPSWVNVTDANALKMGYISNYASSEAREDFVELIAIYVVYGEDTWQSLLTAAGTEGSSKILQKFAIVKDYLKVSWGIEIDDLRDIVQRREAEVAAGLFDLTTLN